jgi:hypothetical protein
MNINSKVIKLKGSLFGCGRFYLSVLIINAISIGSAYYGDFSNWQSPVFIILIGGACLWLLVTSLYYFELDENSLIVKNHLLFWIKKKFERSDIVEICIEKSQKSAVGLRIRTRTGSNKLYEAATIWYPSWRKFKTELEISGLVVRNLAV